MKQAKEGAAVLWCRDCDHFWREWADPKLGWIMLVADPDDPSELKEVQKQPGHAGCPACGCIYVVWENYPEWAKLIKDQRNRK